MDYDALSNAKKIALELSTEERKALIDEILPGNYPWYGKVSGDSLEQGDILENCPVFIPPENLAEELTETSTFDWEERDLILISQSCDLAKGIEKLSEVLFCAILNHTEFSEGDYLATLKGMEDARRGNLPGFHLLAQSDISGLERPVRIVDFRRVYSLPLPFVRKFSVSKSPRLRLLPPYWEHLSQAFARSFMRVGLPVDIPPFK